MKLLVIDVQKGITDNRLYNYESFIENNQKLIAAARENNVEVIYFQHDDGPGTGFSVGDEIFEIADQVAPKEGEKVFIKYIYSCFSNKEFADYMEREGDKDLMIIGLQTNYCIDSTIRSASERGYNVIVPAGANSTFDNDYMNKETTYRYYNELMWPDWFAKCISVENALEILNGIVCEN